MKIKIVTILNLKKAFLIGGMAFILLNAGNVLADTFTDCGITFTSPWYQIKDKNNNPLLTVDNAGNLDVNSTTIQLNIQPSGTFTDSFKIQNQSGIDRFVFNQTNAYISGTVLENQASIPAPSGDDLVIKDISGTAVASFEAGTGNIYLKGKTCGLSTCNISTCQDLQNMKNNLSGNYKLCQDIDCSATSGWNGGAGFEPVGKSTGAFIGSLDGKGFKISNLYINRPTESNVGLFGYMTSLVENVKLENFDIKGKDAIGNIAGYGNGGFRISNSYYAGNLAESNSNYVGGLVGYANGGFIIDNSYSIGSIFAGSGSYVGGLIGYALGGFTIGNSYSSGNITGFGYVGGLVGYRNGGSNIYDSYYTGSVIGGGGSYFGGLIGYSDGGNSINNSYAIGSVLGANVAGGLVGYNTGGSSMNSSYFKGSVSGGGSYFGGLIGYAYTPGLARINDSYALGAILGSSYVGGIVGYADGIDISGSYCAGSVSGTINAGGFIGQVVNGSFWSSYWQEDAGNLSLVGCGSGSCAGVTKKTVDELVRISTYTGWNFSSTWKMVGAGYYPCLAWQNNATCVKPVRSCNINTCQDLQNIKNNLAGTYDLCFDVDCSGFGGINGFEPIGTGTGKVFTGKFDGKGFSITGLSVNNGNLLSAAGLFGQASGAEIKNINLSISINGGVGNVDQSNFGGIIGSSTSSSISNSSVNVSISTRDISQSYLGGFIGRSFGSSSINNSSANGSIGYWQAGQSSLGGLVGEGLVSINNSYSNVRIETFRPVVQTHVGGLVGANYSSINNSYSTGRITTGTQSQCYVGGLVGRNLGGSAVGSYWDTQTSAQATSDGGTGKTTAQMKNQSTYAGWDFTTPIWKIISGVNNGYPCIKNVTLNCN